MVDGMVEIGDGLGLHPLRGVHHEQRSLAGSDAARHLVAEVHMARSVDEVEGVALVFHLDGVALDGDALLALQTHVVQYLVLHLAGIQRLREFEQAVGQGAFSVVDVRNYAKIPYLVHLHRVQR